MNRTSSKESKLPKIGGAVHASSIGKKVTVLTVDSSKEEIVVQAGNMKLKRDHVLCSLILSQVCGERSKRL
ncbi:hypothetical protein K1719_009864 [Acacia pycnantha]|nr:hypothetical protein K1719_009864 [Acacia pycnantha]